jgi:putative membrane protein
MAIISTGKIGRTPGRATTPIDVWKGLAAGLVAGLAAAWVMGQFHQLASRAPGMPTPAAGAEDPTEKTAATVSERLFHYPLGPEEKRAAGSAVHYAFGAAVAGVYGAAAELVPGVTKALGVPFGAAVWLGAHAITVPALGLSEPITRASTPTETVEFAAHLIYGTVTEGLRRLIRRGSRPSVSR